MAISLGILNLCLLQAACGRWARFEIPSESHTFQSRGSGNIDTYYALITIFVS